MKKVLILLSLVFSSFGVSAQISYWDTTFFSVCQAATNTIAPQVATVSGLYPRDSALPCIPRFTQISDTIYFKNYSSYSGLNINYLKIDSIYLPSGLCWSTNKVTNQFAGGEDGVILLSGMIPFGFYLGQYKLRIIVDVNAGPGGSTNLTDQDAETLLRLKYSLRVSCGEGSSNLCPWFNTWDTVDNYIPFVDETCTIGVSDIANNLYYLSVSPNPFGGTAIMSFASENQGTYTVKMTNILGAVVSTKEVNIINGQNDIVIDRNGLSSGMYLLSISNGKSVTTRKVVIE